MAWHAVYFRSFSADVVRILFCMRNVQSWYINHQLTHQFIICITNFEYVFLHLVFLLGIGQFTSEHMLLVSVDYWRFRSFMSWSIFWLVLTRASCICWPYLFSFLSGAKDFLKIGSVDIIIKSVSWSFISQLDLSL